MLTTIYRVGVKTDGKTVYHQFKHDEALLVYLSVVLADAERISITKQKLFSLDEDEKDC